MEFAVIDGLTAGAWVISSSGQVPFWPGRSALEAPWWVSRIVQVERRIQNLIERSAYDPDKLIAPKDLWPSNRAEDLKAWLKGREPAEE